MSARGVKKGWSVRATWLRKSCDGGCLPKVSQTYPTPCDVGPRFANPFVPPVQLPAVAGG